MISLGHGDRTVTEDRPTDDRPTPARLRVQAALGQLEDLGRLIRSSSSGRLLDRTRTLLYLPDAELIEAVFPDRYAKADRGWVEITSTQVRFQGPRRRVTWPLRRVSDVTATDGRLLFHQRGPVSGFRVAADVLPLAQLTVATARQLHTRTLRLTDFQAALADTQARLTAAIT